MKFQITATHIDAWDEEDEKKTELIVNEDEFVNEEEAIAVCEQMARGGFKYLNELHNMESDNIFTPEPPTIEKIKSGWKISYIWEEYIFVANKVD